MHELRGNILIGTEESISRFKPDLPSKGGMIHAGNFSERSVKEALCE